IARRRAHRATPRRSRPSARPVLASPVFEALPASLRRRITHALLTTEDERGVARALLRCFAAWQASPPADAVREALVREIERRASSGACEPLGHLVGMPGFVQLKPELQRRMIALLAPAAPGLAPSLRIDGVQEYLRRLRRKSAEDQRRLLTDLIHRPAVSFDLVGSRRWLGHVYVVSRVDGETELYSMGQRFERSRYTLVSRRPERFLRRWPRSGTAAQQLYDRARFRISRWEEHLMIGALESTFAPNRLANTVEDTRLLELGPEALRLITFVCAHRQGPEQPEIELQRAGRAATHSTPPSEHLKARERLRQMLAEAKRTPAPELPKLVGR
ncbi:MAG: hypothetical protein AAFV29_10755, partial [Myxococcota bacterium]